MDILDTITLSSAPFISPNSQHSNTVTTTLPQNLSNIASTSIKLFHWQQVSRSMEHTTCFNFFFHNSSVYVHVFNSQLLWQWNVCFPCQNPPTKLNWMWQILNKILKWTLKLHDLNTKLLMQTTFLSLWNQNPNYYIYTCFLFYSNISGLNRIHKV